MGFFVTGQWSNPGNMMDTQICATQKCWWIRGWNALLTPGGINTSLVLLNQTVLRVISRLFKSSWWIGAYTSGSVATLKTDTSGIGFPDFPNHSPAPHSCSLGSLPSFELSFQICLSRASRIRHVGLDFSSPSNTVYTINHQLLLFGVFFFFLSALMACGNSQARDQMCTVAVEDVCLFVYLLTRLLKCDSYTK